MDNKDFGRDLCESSIKCTGTKFDSWILVSSSDQLSDERFLTLC